MTTKGSQQKLPDAPIIYTEMEQAFEEVFCLDQDGLTDHLKEFGFKNAKSMAKGFFRLATSDLPDDKWVDTSDFLEEYVRMQLFRSIRAIINNHELYDDDKNGRISRKELNDVLVSQLGVQKAQRLVDECFIKMDKDDSGDLCEDELKNWYKEQEDTVKAHRHTLKAMDRETKKKRREKKVRIKKACSDIARDFGEMPPGTELEQHELLVVWNKYDKDHSGTIDRGELQSILDDVIESLQSQLESHVRSTLLSAGFDETEIQSNVDEAKEKVAKINTAKLAKKFIEQMGEDGQVLQNEFLDKFQDIFQKAQRPLKVKSLIKRAKTKQKSESSSSLTAAPALLAPLAEE